MTPFSLQKLVRAHLEQVPFEVLELTEEKTQPSMEPEGLYEKIVVNNRGGYCFELNKLFYLLLKELGFSCYCAGVRCIIGRPEPVAISHRGIIVEFPGQKWYCDVGFGGNGPKGILNLLTTETQTICYYKEHGVELIVHHSDSYAATLVPDMIDMGIDIWQGVMTCNNIPELIKQYGGKISFMGGIDSATIDYPGWSVADVEREVDRACRECGKLYFIPGASQGLAVSTFPGASQGLAVSTFPGVYEETTRQIDLASKRYF